MLDKDVIAQLIADIGDDVFLRLSKQFLDETIERLETLLACHFRNSTCPYQPLGALARQVQHLSPCARRGSQTLVGCRAVMGAGRNRCTPVEAYRLVRMVCECFSAEVNDLRLGSGGGCRCES